MDAGNQDSATGDGAGGVTQRIKDYCDWAVANLKAGRLKEAYLFANEAMELDQKDAKAAALCRYVLYALHPKKRLLDKAKTLHEEADRYIKADDYGKALKLLSLAKKWHCTPGLLCTRAQAYYPCRRFDLAYVDSTEGLAERKKDKVPFVSCQRMCLSQLGYKVLPASEPDPVPRPNEVPAHYHVRNWPQGLRINDLIVYLSQGFAEAMKIGGTVLRPYIPLNQLAQFLNHHVQGAVENLSFFGRPQGMLPRLLDEMIVPGRLQVDMLNFAEFFHLPWANIERILDGRTLRANQIGFLHLQLPSGVDPNKLLKLPAVRDCASLEFLLYNRDLPQPPRLPPLFFTNAALLEWLKRGKPCLLELAREYLSSGLLSFLDALKKDFRQATQVHSFEVTIHCLHIGVFIRLGVRDEELSNRLGEKMVVDVGEDPTAVATTGYRFETVVVRRLPPSWR